MKVKNNSLLYFYVILGCVGLISVLAISIPDIYQHYRKAEVLSNAINVNLANNNGNLAALNKQFLESQNNALKSSINSTIIMATLILISVTSGFMATYLQKSKQEEKQNTE